MVASGNAEVAEKPFFVWKIDIGIAIFLSLEWHALPEKPSSSDIVVR